MGCRRLIGVVVVALAFGQPSAIRAEFWQDPEPPLSWLEMLSCELVVLARYESHQDTSFTVTVIKSIKGDVAAGQSLTVSLEHLYTLETGRVGWEWRNPNVTPDGVPKLCYKQQMVDDLVPVLLLPDARKPAIYFFPKRAQPSLKRLQQVQSPLLEHGWRQALSGEPMGLWFRLRQQVDRDVARDALEELGKTRDSGVLSLLFDQVRDLSVRSHFDHFMAAPLLARLGDRNGDVYDRAAKSFFDAAPGTNPARFSLLAAIMASVSADRARGDLMRSLETHRDIAILRAALHGLAGIANRPVAEKMVALLRDPELAGAAAGSLRNVYHGSNVYSFPKSQPFEDKEWLLKELQMAAFSPNVPEPVRNSLNESSSLLFTEVLGIHEVMRRLTDLSNRDYFDPNDYDAAALHRRTQSLCDPRFVPFLVNILDRNYPGAMQQSEFRNSLEFYATVCPRLMHAELEKRDLPERLRMEFDQLQQRPSGHFMVYAGIWPEPTAFQTDEVARCFRLAQQVREGTTNESELITATEEMIARYRDDRTNFFLVPQALPALLESKSSAAMERYLHHVDKMKQGSINLFAMERIVPWEVPSLIGRLFPDYFRFYFREVMELLESNWFSERKAGHDALITALQCDFGFDHEALKADRSAVLAKIKPVFEQMTGKSELEARRILLAHLGVELPGEPGDAWFAVLERAAASSDPNLGRNAVRIIELLVGQQGLRRIEHLPHAQRGRAVAVYLRDIGKIVE